MWSCVVPGDVAVPGQVELRLKIMNGGYLLYVFDFHCLLEDLRSLYRRRWEVGLIKYTALRLGGSHVPGHLGQLHQRYCLD